MQWLRQSIPDFSNLIRPLLVALDRGYVLAKNRTKKGLRRLTMSQINWTEADEQAFKNFKEALRNRITLSHRNP